MLKIDVRFFFSHRTDIKRKCSRWKIFTRLLMFFFYTTIFRALANDMR